MYDDQMKYADEIAVLAREALVLVGKVSPAFASECIDIRTLACDLESAANKLYASAFDAERAEERKQLFPEIYR